jgi:hypothetical protein
VAGSDSAEGRPAPPDSLSEALQYLEAVHELVSWAPVTLVPARETIAGLQRVRHCQKFVEVKKINGSGG